MTMNRHEVTWWSVSIEALGVTGFAALAAVCDDDEMARAGRFVFERDRLAYLAAHGLLRRALSRVEPSHGPRAWRFSMGRYGRPELVEQFRCRPRFNLSHCETRVTCVVSAAIPCGVDVEPLRRRTDRAVMDACLAPSERARIAQLDDVRCNRGRIVASCPQIQRRRLLISISLVPFCLFIALRDSYGRRPWWSPPSSIYSEVSNFADKHRLGTRMNPGCACFECPASYCPLSNWISYHLNSL
ncbi:4'-phosphopantetheinyl transferase family protein [Verminephrobacter aporrectodeae]|uniref:4'-phosphopantetheinyl transferase family protein n=1 Tax=Verminephrobacter aporrectodeae TaxID=1110389 RepID=UPI0022373F73|nr:hypothetical protein [Verminephrobacter aporrectodeae]